MRKLETCRALHTVGFGGVVEENPGRLEVMPDKIEEFNRQEIRGAGAKMPRRVRDNGIEVLRRIGAQPPAAVIRDDFDLRIGENRSDLGLLFDQGDIAWIDLDDGQ